MSHSLSISSISPWWVTKNLGSLSLIGYAVFSTLKAPLLAKVVTIPLPVVQGLIVGGLAIFLGHYGVFKRGTENLTDPETVVTSGGLLGVIRHPMYLGDALWTAGFALFVGDGLALAGVAVVWISLGAQSIWEDRRLAEKFGETFEVWCRRTWRLVPGVF